MAVMLMAVVLGKSEPRAISKRGQGARTMPEVHPAGEAGASFRFGLCVIYELSWDSTAASGSPSCSWALSACKWHFRVSISE